MIQSRRGFLAGFGAILGAGIITAPTIVRAASLMPVKAIKEDHYLAMHEHIEYELLNGPLEMQHFTYDTWNKIIRKVIQNYEWEHRENIFNMPPPAKIGQMIRIKLPVDFTVRSDELVKELAKPCLPAM